jgi:hypothetical protein
LKKREYFEKFVRSEQEISNLLFIFSISPQIIPEIKEIKAESYIIEKCCTISILDITPIWFKRVLNRLNENLYVNTSDSFSTGIYKYFFTSDCIKLKKDNEFYLPYLCSELLTLTKILGLDKDKTVKIQLNAITDEVSNSSNWAPIGGFKLLHGDLHSGNIVKKNSKIFLIDFEYLRYGAIELETANFLISCILLLYNKKGLAHIELQEFLGVLGKQTNIDRYVFNNIMLKISFLLFYIGFRTRNDERMIKSLSEINNYINSYKN